MVKENLPDVQETKPKIQIPINQVGVENVEVPFMLQTKNGPFHELTAKTSIRTNLGSNKKGISMSRLILTLRPFLMKPLKHFLINDILTQLKTNLGTDDSFIKFEFKLPLIKKSPKSENEFPLYYNCQFEGKLVNDKFSFYQAVKVQYASYCPCSAELSKDLLNKGYSSQGFPHAQRSYATVAIEPVKDKYIWLEDIIELVEKSIATIPYPIIKRIDEQEIARIASENPIFVEDAIRQISSSLNSKSEIYDWIIKCSHEESIHTHEAIAISYKGIKEGFNDRSFII